MLPRVVGVFGGSGFYAFLEDVREEAVETPYGPTSAPLAVGEIEGTPVAFMARHGVRHELPPAQIPYRANLWAMREVGVRHIVGPAACGSLRADLAPGDLVVCDQFGQGPRFSTRAESEWYAAQGWDVVNMTAYPEAWLARELELCYANVSMVTDYDAGAGGNEPVSADAVVRVFAENLEKLRALLLAAIPRIGAQPDDVCATALTGARL